MAHRLSGVRAKLHRSAKHLRELDTKVSAFFKGEPYRIVLEYDADSGWYRGWFRVNRYPPIELGVIAGEVIGQYRSALDHLMTQLAALHGTRCGHFPIYPGGRFWRTDKKAGGAPKDRYARLVRPEHFAILERLQPREVEPIGRPGVLSARHALVVTQWVANIDKHELVRPAFLSPLQVGVAYQPNVAAFEWIMAPWANLYDGTEMYRVKFVSEENVEVPFRLTPDLTFGELPHPWITASTMRIYGKRIREIVRRFVRVTPEFRV